MSERDYPVGHPAASDYNGQKYTPPRAPWQDDFDADSPARGGANTNPLDTPDGMREHQNKLSQDLAELAAIGALPADYKPATTPVGVPDARKAEAADYLRSRGYDDAGIEQIFTRYTVDDVLRDKAEQQKH